MNYAGLAELGWRATQKFGDKNAYDDWEQLSDVDKQIVQLRWEAIPKQERERLERIVCAATDAFAAAALV